MKLNDYEQTCLDNATSFTAVRGFGGKRTRAEFNTFDDAMKHAANFGDKRTMIYAIVDFGNAAHICNA